MSYNVAQIQTYGEYLGAGYPIPSGMGLHTEGGKTYLVKQSDIAAGAGKNVVITVSPEWVASSVKAGATQTTVAGTPLPKTTTTSSTGVKIAPAAQKTVTQTQPPPVEKPPAAPPEAKIPAVAPPAAVAPEIPAGAGLLLLLALSMM